MHSRRNRTIALGTVLFVIFAVSLVVMRRSSVSAHAAVLIEDWGTEACPCLDLTCGGTRRDLEFDGATYCVPSCDADISDATEFEEDMFDFYCGETDCLPNGQPNWDDLFAAWEASCEGGGDPPNEEVQPKPGEVFPDPGDGGCDGGETMAVPTDSRPVDLF